MSIKYLVLWYRNLSDDNLQFRSYLLDFKTPQLRSLVHLGNRKPHAGLNVYVLLKPTLVPLLSGRGHLLLDTENPRVHPWWSLNASDAQQSLKPLTEVCLWDIARRISDFDSTHWDIACRIWDFDSTRCKSNRYGVYTNVDECNLQRVLVVLLCLYYIVRQKIRRDVTGMTQVLSIIGIHIERILKPTDSLIRHPVPSEVFAKEKHFVYERARAMKDTSKLATLVYTGPMPHTPEFDKLLPDFEGLLYRRDPFNDWGVVRVALISSFLVILHNLEDSCQDRSKFFLSTESLVPLLEEDVEIKLFSVSIQTI